MSSTISCILKGRSITDMECVEHIRGLTAPEDISTCRDTCEYGKSLVASVADLMPGQAKSVSSDVIEGADRDAGEVDQAAGPVSDFPRPHKLITYHSVNACLKELARRNSMKLASATYCYRSQFISGVKPAANTHGEKLLQFLTDHGLTWQDISLRRFLAPETADDSSGDAAPADAHITPTPEQTPPQMNPPKPDPAFPLPSIPVDSADAEKLAGVDITESCVVSRPGPKADPAWHDPDSPIFKTSEALLPPDAMPTREEIVDDEDPTPTQEATAWSDLDALGVGPEIWARAMGISRAAAEELKDDPAPRVCSWRNPICKEDIVLRNKYDSLEGLLVRIRKMLPRGATITITL